MLSSASTFFVNAGVIDDVVEVFIDHSRRPTDPDLIGRKLWAMNAETLRHEPTPIGIRDRLRNNHHVDRAQAYRFRRGSDYAPQRAKSCACFLQQCDLPVNAHNPLLRDLKLIIEDAPDLETWSVDEVWNRPRENYTSDSAGTYERLML